MRTYRERIITIRSQLLSYPANKRTKERNKPTDK